MNLNLMYRPKFFFADIIQKHEIFRGEKNLTPLKMSPTRSKKKKSNISSESKRQILEEIIPTLICSKCKKPPGPEKETNQRFNCVKNGHALCHTCKAECHCGSQVSEAPSQLYVDMLKILPWYCVNYSEGCREIFTESSNYQKHMKTCPCRSVPCIFYFQDECYETIQFKDWLEHIEKEHGDADQDFQKDSIQFSNGIWQSTFRCSVSLQGIDDRDSWIPILLKSESETFIFQRCVKGDTFSAWFVCMESNNSEQQIFDYSIAAYGRNGEEVTYKGKCFSHEAFEEHVERKRLYFTMTTSTAEYFADDDNVVILHVSLSKFKKEVKDEELASGMSYLLKSGEKIKIEHSYSKVET